MRREIPVLKFFFTPLAAPGFDLDQARLRIGGRVLMGGGSNCGELVTAGDRGSCSGCAATRVVDLHLACGTTLAGAGIGIGSAGLSAGKIFGRQGFLFQQ